jgi:hypothetical protein
VRTRPAGDAGTDAPGRGGAADPGTDRGGAAASRGAAAAWRRTPAWVRVLVVVVAAVLCAEFGVSLAGSRTVPTATTSPFSAGPQGTAAFVALVRRVAPVAVATAPLHAGTVPPGGTLLVLDPRRWSRADAAVAASVARTGGRVVFVGAAPATPGPTLPAGAAVRWRPDPAGEVTTTSSGRLALGVRTLATGVGSLVVTGPVRVDVATAAGAFVASAGAVVWVGSSAPLRNADLGAVDDAALAWNLVAPFGRPVVLDASDQTPPATATGLRSLPSWWLGALAVAALAAVAWLVSAARRFGPLEAPSRRLAPARVGHAEAMGALLAGLPSRHVAEVARPVAEAASTALRRRVALPADAPTDEVVAAAGAHEVPDWVATAATATPASRDEAVSTGRALAWLLLEEGER